MGARPVGQRAQGERRGPDGQTCTQRSARRGDVSESARGGDGPGDGEGNCVATPSPTTNRPPTVTHGVRPSQKAAKPAAVISRETARRVSTGSRRANRLPTRRPTPMPSTSKPMDPAAAPADIPTRSRSSSEAQTVIENSTAMQRTSTVQDAQ